MINFQDPTGSLINILILLPGLLLAITIHEFSHAIMSDKLGDPTPGAMGRLTLSPFAHIDAIGLIALVLLGFGWGKPVQVNPSYYKHPKRDSILVALAGPVSNVLMAIIFAILLKIYNITIEAEILAFNQIVYSVFLYAMNINVVLFVFNLIPVYPLDGFNIVYNLCPYNARRVLDRIIPYSTIILIILIVTPVISVVISPVINGIESLLMLLIQ